MPLKKPKRSKWVRLGFHTTIRQEQEKRLYFYEKIYSLICLCVLPPPRGAKPLSQIKIFVSECQDLAW